jgi:phenylacetate-coenzyme A ligase PaaK-like adenylate-forming protein
MSFGGMNLSQLVLGVLGAVFVAGEYTTGMIRTMFAAVAGRVSILSAKAVVLGASSWIVMTIASFAVFFAGQAAGMMVLSTGGGKVMGSSGDLRAMSRLKADALIGVPGYVYHLLRRAAAERMDLSSLRCVVLGAERVPPGMKDKLQLLLGEVGARNVRIFGTYGFTEARMAFAECPTKDNAYTGYHL